MNATKDFYSLCNIFPVLVTVASCLLFAQPGANAQPAVSIRTNYHAMVLYYNPDVWRDGVLRSYRETYSARDIDALCADYIKFLKRASGGQVNFDVAYRFELKEFPPDNDPNVTFTSENYHDLLLSHYDMWDHGHANYVAICEDPRFGIVPKVESGEVDAIWIFAPNNTGFWETAMAGQDAYWINGAPYPEVNCSRRFVLYGFGSDGHQGVGYMLENTAHMTELIMHDRIASGWPLRNAVAGWNTMDLTNPGREPVTWNLHDWDLFTCSDGMHWDTKLVFPGHSQAGLSHFPPTACFNYGWDDPLITFLSWEAENILYLDASWVPGDRVLVVSNTGPVIAKAMLNGSHDETDFRGRYRVPIALTDFDVEAGITLLQTNETSHAGITFRFSRYADDLGNQDGYYVALHPTRDRIQLYRLGPTTGHTLITEAPCPLEPNTNYSVFLSVRNSNVTVRLDPQDPPVLSWPNLQISFGGIGMGAGGGGTASFTRFYLTPMLENYAESWRNYPHPQGQPRRLSSAEWAGDGAPYTDMDNFYAWWYEHIPKNPGLHMVTDQYGNVLGNALNTWWPYIFDINTFDTPFVDPGTVVYFPTQDVTPPETPQDLRGIGSSSREILIEWNEPEDNIGVTRYEVYRDGALAARLAKPSFLDRYLAAGSTHEYAVVALDGSANASMPCTPIRVATGKAGEALRNGSFEEGLSAPLAWSHEAFNPAALQTWEPPPAGCYGSRCVSITASIPNHALWIQQVTGLVPSGRYLFTGMIKGQDIVVEPGGHSGASIGRFETWETQNWLLAGTFDWTPAACFLTADASGSLTVACRLGHHGSLASGIVWFDELRLDYAPVVAQPFHFSGTDPNWIATPPGGLADCLTLCAGDAHALALKPSGYLIAWGDSSKGQLNPPWPAGSDLKLVAAGANHSLGLRHNGQLVAWGDNASGQCIVPTAATNVLALAAGGNFSICLRADSSVLAWGDNQHSQTNVPPNLGRAIGINAGRTFATALLSNGTVRVWGRYQADNGSFVNAFVPAGLSNVTSMACGHNHVLALLANGTVQAWGRNAEGQSTVPPNLSNVVHVAAGARHSVALKSDGTLVSWGNLATPTTATNVFAIAAGPDFTLALMRDRPPRVGCRVNRITSENNVLKMDTLAPAGSPVFLLRTETLGSGTWSVASGDASINGLLNFKVPMAGPQSFFRVKSVPW